MVYIPPCQITPEQFTTYSQAWRTMVNGPNASSLSTYFTTSAGLINYVFLPRPMAQALLNANPEDVALVFALVPAGEGLTRFSMMLAGLSSTNQFIPPYYQAGVGGRAVVNTLPIEAPADTADTIPQHLSAIGDPIPYTDAVTWIQAWNALTADGLGPAQFDSGVEGSRLFAYVYPTADLTNALASPPPVPGASSALWFDFVLHPEAPKFSTVLALDATPTTTNPGIIYLSRAASYFDISKPSPPAHPGGISVCAD